MADQILAAIPAQPTPSGDVDGLVAEVDALFEKATDGPWTTENGDSVVQIHNADGICFATVSSVQYWERFSDEDGANAALIVALVNAWPRLRTALGGGWRPISEAPKDGTRVLVVGGRLVIERSFSLSGRERTTLDEAYIAKWAGDEADDANEWLIEMDEEGVTWWADPVWWKPITPPQLEGET